MKKIAFSLVLLFVFAFTALAEGDIHIGAKTCPQNQTCLVESNQTKSENDNPIISAIKNFIKFIF